MSTAILIECVNGRYWISRNGYGRPVQSLDAAIELAAILYPGEEYTVLE